MSDLPVLENFDVLSNFDALSDLPQPVSDESNQTSSSKIRTQRCRRDEASRLELGG